MKKIVVVLLLLVSVLSLTAGAIAQQFYVYENPNDSDETIKVPVDQAHVIGTIRFCVEEAQRLPAEIDGAICDGDDDAYNSKMAELASCIAQANSAMTDTKMPNTLNLWRIYSILKEKNCGVGAAATSHADWAREELDRVGQRIGAIDSVNCPIDLREVYRPAGSWDYVNANFQLATQNHDLHQIVVSCEPDGSLNWVADPADLYDDGSHPGGPSIFDFLPDGFNFL